LALAAFVLSGISVIKGQADCGYIFQVYLRDEAGKTITKAKVRLSSGASLFYQDDIEGYEIFGLLGVGSPERRANLKVSAKGFETFLKEINYSCSKQRGLLITLRPKGSKTSADITELIISGRKIVGPSAWLTGRVYDANGAVIVGAEVSAISDNHARHTTHTNGRGEYEFMLPYNKYDPQSYAFKEARYDIIVEKEGFKRSVTKGFVFIPSQFGKMHLDIALEISGREEGHQIIVPTERQIVPTKRQNDN
jgi:hypothetical protein